MIDLPDVLAAAATALSAIPDVFVADYVQPQPSTPTIQVFPATVDYSRAMDRGLDVCALTVQALVDVSEAGQRRLYRFMSGTGMDSVVVALWADPTLGLDGCHSSVGQARGPQLASIASVPYLLTEWTVTINLS